MFQKKIMTPAGPIYLVSDDVNIRGAYWKPQTDPFENAGSGALELLDEAEKQIQEYFEGLRTDFDLPVLLEGTQFQKKVWKALSEIPYGETISYKELANMVKQPNACRAVGGANGRNPASIIVPCHRVVSADGKLGGYAGGPEAKRALLRLEGSFTL